jgi:hypothetical protein
VIEYAVWLKRGRSQNALLVFVLTAMPRQTHT